MDLNEFLEEILTSPKHEIGSVLSRVPLSSVAELLARHPSKVANPILGGLDRSMATALISTCSPSVMRGALQNCSIETLNSFLKVIQATQLTRILEKANNDLVKKLIEAAPSHNMRIGISKSLPIERRRQWLQLVRDMEKDVGRTRAMTSEAASSLFEERKLVLSELEDAIRERETNLRTLEKETKSRRDHFASLTREEQLQLDKWHGRQQEVQAKLLDQERMLAIRVAELEELNRKQVQQRIEVKVPEYVAAALAVLDEREALFRNKAFWWSVQGVLVLSVAIVGAIAISVYGTAYGPPLTDLTWQTLLFVSFKGLVVLGVLGLWAKHAFTVSNAYMHESIKRSDRAHAINFGKLYLEIYGNSVERRELIDIFENWNITSESAFTKANPISFSPEIIEKVDSLLKALGKNKEDEK